MQEFFLTRILRWAGSKMDGYKTRISGVAMILGGNIGLIGIMFPDQGLPQMSVEGAIGLITGGLAVLGIGGKTEKIKTAIEVGSPTIRLISDDKGFTRLPVLAALLLAMVLFAGCATTETPQSLAAKSLLTTRQGIIAAATTVDGLCSQGVMKQQDCDRAAAMYTQAQAAYVTASDTFLLYLQLSDSASLRKFQDAQLTLQALFLDIDGLAKSFKGGTGK